MPLPPGALTCPAGLTLSESGCLPRVAPLRRAPGFSRIESARTAGRAVHDPEPPEVNPSASTTRDARRTLDPQGQAIFFTIGGRSFIFNGNTGEFIDEVPPELGSWLGASPARPDVVERLRRLGWLAWLDAYRDGSHADLQAEDRQVSFVQTAAPDRYVICIAQACNLACSYCINQRGSYGGSAKLMSRSTAAECAAFLERQLDSEDCTGISVVLFGGEPLLAPQSTGILVDGLLNGRSRTGKPIGAMLCTNGTVYDENLFRTFAVHADSFSVAVSIDGSQENHDKHRPFATATGGSTWTVATGTVRRLLEDGVRVSVTCVVPAPYCYIERAEELHALGVGRIEIKPVIPHVYGCSEKPDVLRSDFEQWRTRYLAYTEWCLERGGMLPPGRIVHNDRVVLLREYSRQLDGESPRRLGCAAGDEGAAIDVEGNIFPCDAFVADPSRSMGTVTSGIDPGQRAALAQWLLDKGQHRIDVAKCRSCHAKRFCGGGCYAVSHDRGGELAPLDDFACAFVRERVLIDLYYVSRVRRENPEAIARVFRGVSM